LSSSCFNAVVNLHSCFCQELSEILFHCYVCLHVFSALALLVWRRDQNYTVGFCWYSGSGQMRKPWGDGGKTSPQNLEWGGRQCVMSPSDFDIFSVFSLT